MFYSSYLMITSGDWVVRGTGINTWILHHSIRVLLYFTLVWLDEIRNENIVRVNPIHILSSCTVYTCYTVHIQWLLLESEGYRDRYLDSPPFYQSAISLWLLLLHEIRNKSIVRVNPIYILSRCTGYTCYIYDIYLNTQKCIIWLSDTCRPW